MVSSPPAFHTEEPDALEHRRGVGVWEATSPIQEFSAVRLEVADGDTGPKRLRKLPEDSWCGFEAQGRRAVPVMKTRGTLAELDSIGTICVSLKLKKNINTVFRYLFH